MEVRGEDSLVEGSLLVAELGPGPGLPVWRALRDVRRWAGARAPAPPPGRVPALGAARLPEPLWAPLAVLACLADGIGPADAARVLHACRRIAGWAEGRRAWRTALAWEAEAARVRAALRASV
jgi:hypothetical protein